MPDMSENETHPLDVHLGNIHEIALSLAFNGSHNTGMVLAKAHEAIQRFVLDLERRADALEVELAVKQLRITALEQSDVDNLQRYLKVVAELKSARKPEDDAKG